MKLTDGLFHRIFNEIGEEYPEIEKDHRIIDIGSALLADTPERFDVIVTLNLYGDIISDIAAQVAGSVGLCGSANVGDQCAMFEAIHGSAPDITGLGIANPSGLLNGAIMMLVHINQPDVATKIHNAWLKTLEDRIHTADIYVAGKSDRKVSTSEFADAVIERLGKLPQHLKPVSYGEARANAWEPYPLAVRPQEVKTLLGVDVFLDWTGKPEDLAAILKGFEAGKNLGLKMISNRGVNAWPNGIPETFLSDHWRCRYEHSVAPGDQTVTHEDITTLLNDISMAGLDFIKIENLYAFDGKKGYSAGQGE
jgi:isocitrate dehydrogenase